MVYRRVALLAVAMQVVVAKLKFPVLKVFLARQTLKLFLAQSLVHCLISEIHRLHKPSIFSVFPRKSDYVYCGDGCVASREIV